MINFLAKQVLSLFFLMSVACNILIAPLAKSEIESKSTKTFNEVNGKKVKERWIEFSDIEKAINLTEGDDTKNRMPGTKLKPYIGPSYNDFIKNKKTWEDLKKILAKDILTSTELGIVACSSFKRPPVEIELKHPYKAWRLMQQNESWILNTFYKWNTYELNGKDRCIEMIEPKQKYLSLLDSQILLSANKNHHFESLNLEPSTIYREIKYTKSSDSNCNYYESVFGIVNYSLQENDCVKEKTFVVNKIPLRVFNQYTGIKNNEQNEVENFTSMMNELIKCDLWPVDGFKQYKKSQIIKYTLNYSNYEAPPLCIQNTNNIVLNENKNIELYFTTKNLSNVAQNGGYLVKFKTQTESIRKKMIQNQVDILLIKLGLFTKNNKYNYGFIDKAITGIKKRQEFRKEFSSFKQRQSHKIKLDENFKKYSIIKNPKSKIVIYIRFQYGEDANYNAKYDLDKNLTVIKLN